VEPEILFESRIMKVVQRLKEIEFLKDTRFEKMAVASGLDPYSVLLGILIGMAATVVIGFLTMELWLPRAISRVTQKTVRETQKIVREVLYAGRPTG